MSESSTTMLSGDVRKMRKMEDLREVDVPIEAVVGLDLGDRKTQLCVLDMDSGDVAETGQLRTTRDGFVRRFAGVAPMRIVIEVGTHSPWVSELLSSQGHDVLVANARQLALIYNSSKKSDKVDAEMLARLARLDPKLLSPIEHRGSQARADLAVIRSRDLLVRIRTQLTVHCRGVVKSVGERLASCDTATFPSRVKEDVPSSLRPSLFPVLEVLDSITAQIQHLDQRLETLARESYPETEVLQQVAGVGPLGSMAFILTLEDPKRFPRSRSVGSYFGLVPRQDQSGDSCAQLGITKEGDALVRRLLVQSGHYILGPFAPDSDLRRHGLKIAERGGKSAKKRAVVAVARKLAILLHRLWLNGEVYDPLYNAQRVSKGTDGVDPVTCARPS